MTDATKAVGEQAFPKSQADPPSRRNVLLAGTAMAATVLSTSSVVEQAQAQQNPAAPPREANPTSLSSWATTSACGISVRITAA
jgi:hypothetical protein